MLSPVLSRLVPVRRGVIRENLERALPEAPAGTVNRLIVETYRNFLFFVIEFIHIVRLGEKMKKKRDDRPGCPRITEIEGEEHFASVGSGKKPFLVLTGHLGNWELMGAFFALKGAPLSVLAKPIHNPYVNRHVNRVREANGLEVISTRKMPMRPVLKAIRAGRGVVFLADQDARRAGIFVDFFGHPASTFTGPALFCVRTGLPLLPVFDIRTGLFSHKTIFLPPIYPPGDMEREEAIRHITEKHVKCLEEMIRRYPDQYFWFHRRWKSREKK